MPSVKNAAAPRPWTTVADYFDGSIIPDGFPSVHRLGMSKLFRELLGVDRSTFAQHLRTGRIPQPEGKLGRLSFWRETTMAAVVVDDLSATFGTIEARALFKALGFTARGA